MRLRLVKFQAEHSKAWKIKAEKLGKNWKIFEKILHYLGLSYIFEIIITKLISKHNNNPQTGDFGIK